MANTLRSILGTSSPTLGLRLLVLLKTIERSVNTNATHANMDISVLNLIMALALNIIALKIINIDIRKPFK